MTAPACTRAPLPRRQGLSPERAAGRACVVCGESLTTGAVSRGWLRGRSGVHVLDVEVWACPEADR